MSSGIYLIQAEGRLVEMTQQPYGTEDLLQALLAKYPNLLAGDQIDSAVPRRWMLISRELGVPDEENGSDRWALDHLFLDQDAIPTLVEVKRSSDTRLRREVIGQMLDYAANGVAYWSMEELRATFEKTCGDKDPAQVLAEFLNDGLAAEAYWQRVKTNLQAGKIRLLFVADEVPTEVRRIIEFLNEQMDPAEVLAVEIKQYAAPGNQVLIPRVIGQTAEAERKKAVSSGEKRQWNEASFFHELEIKRSVEEVNAAHNILAWANTKTTRVWWGQGRKWGSFVPVLSHGDKDYSLFAVRTNAIIEVYFGPHLHKAPFDVEQKRLELRERLNAIPEVSIPLDATSGYPGVRLIALRTDLAMKQFLDVFDWVVSEIKAL